MDQRTVNDSPLVLITGGLNIPRDIFVSEPNWRAKASLEAGGGGRESAFGRLSPGHGASPTALAVPADQTWGKEFEFEEHSPSSLCLFGIARGSGAGGDARAEISALQGLKKAQQAMGNQHRKQEGNKGQALGL